MQASYRRCLITETRRHPRVSLPLGSKSLMKRYPDARRSRRIHAQAENGSRLMDLIRGASSSILNLYYTKSAGFCNGRKSLAARWTERKRARQGKLLGVPIPSCAAYMQAHGGGLTGGHGYQKRKRKARLPTTMNHSTSASRRPNAPANTAGPVLPVHGARLIGYSPGQGTRGFGPRYG